ncbi:TonB-dependent receptor [Diaphorobacter ruginosibacter]|uniref:TonB-dependent receptor n=1 Tax=Diaphorobacter ruginosibacter TaxID=1715720 RepID=A0A7G9RQD0_9BURK|nr:TonB-dependent receptor [Diaphorobacter ruginosibacter]QNN57805.1 TonB-dependent receptor [Diaphorobacter ruginosibacter]
MKSQRPHVKKPRSLRLVDSVAAAAVLLPLGAMAQTAATPPAATSLSTVTVSEQAIDPNPNAEVGAPYKAKTSADSRHTRPLAETPQTISVVTKSAIDDSGATDLKQILSAQPGITLGTGENGNAFGDRYIIRGQEARSDVFVDGLRDPGMTTRESFAVEQIEITKGPNSTFAGRGSAGGAVNVITKQATLDYDFTRLSGSVGTDSHYRLMMDANKAINDTFALRVNALVGSEDVPDRGPSERKRKGLALSGLWEVNSDLSVTLDYYGFRGKDNQPDLGGYLVGTAPARYPASNVPVYAQGNDFLKSDVDTLTARINYRLSSDLKLNSLTRYGTSSNGYATTGASSRTAYNPDGSTYTTAGIDSGHTGWQEVHYFAHQSNLRWDKVIGGMKHEIITGFEYTDHMVKSGNYAITNANAFNCRTSATATANNGWCFTNAAGTSFGDPSSLAGRSYSRNGWNRDWQVRTYALSLMDTVDLTDQWTVFGGVRADHYKLSMLTRNNTTGAQTGDYGFSDTLFNGHLGVSYKINPMGMVYAGYGTAQDINGGEPDAGTNSGYGGLVIYNGSAAGAKPERSENIEIGTKWNLLDDKLLATAAMFQTTKSDVMEGADYGTTGTFNTGKNRVRGVEFGLAGNVTKEFQVQAGVAIMKSKVLKSATAANVGRPLSNFADRSFSLQGKYQLTKDFSIGAIARHESDRCGGQPDTAAGYTASGVCSQPVPSFTVYDAFASYRINKHADVRLNVLNLTNKDYYTAVYRSGAFLYKGDARAVRLTLNLDL